MSTKTGGIVALFAALLMACGSATPAPSVPTPAQARAEARGAVETAEAAWLLAANACVDAAALSGKPQLATDCGTVLLPARDALIAAAGDVDAWEVGAGLPTPAAAVACELAAVSVALEAVSGLGVKLPSVVTDSQTLAASLVCPAVDAGKDGAK